MRRRPGRLEPLLERLGIVARLEGAFETDGNVLVTRLGADERTIDVEGPQGYQPEDLADDLDARFLAAAPGARWLAGIHLPGGYGEPEDRWAIDLAIELARENDGAVWDPQAERVLWPEGVAPTSRRVSAPKPTRPAARLVMTWHVPQGRLAPDVASDTLGLLRAYLPGGVPSRFGHEDPYARRLERDGDAAFVEDWRLSATERRFGWLLTWDGSAPWWSGMAQFRQGDGRRLAPDLVLSIDADDAPLHDGAAADRVAEGLCSIADALDAAYAQAHVEATTPEILPSGSVVSPFRDVKATGWSGIPWDPTWLAWFGRPYADRLESVLADHVDVRTASGLLVRVGRLPAPRAELRGAFPHLPPELVQEEYIVGSTPDGSPRTQLRPAAEIPPLGQA